MRKPVRFIGAAAVLCAAAMAAVAAPDQADLIRDLGGPDDVARSLARQWLPRYGAAAVPDILPLLKHEDPNISGAAKNTLADIANEAAVPGREAECRRIADAFAGLIEANQPESIRITGLELLTVAVPEGYDVSPIAAMLDEPALRDRAREALELAGTTEARTALRTALDGAEPEVQCALLRSLEKLQDPAALEAIRALTDSGDARVRAAAARALSGYGEAEDIDRAIEVVDGADDATASEALDALIRVLDGRVRRAGPSAQTTAGYRHALEAAREPHLRGAALVGLIRHGGPEAREDVAAALAGEKGAELALPALSALENAPGGEVNDTIRALYGRVSPELQAQLVRLCGRRHDPALLDLIDEAAMSGNPEVREAAREALADSRLPGAASRIAARAGEPDAKVAALERMIEGCRVHGPVEVAGEAYLALYRLADTPERRASALEGVLKFPTAESFDIVAKAVESGELTDSALPTLCSLAGTLREQGRTEEADRAVALAASRARTADEIALLLSAAQGIPDLATRLGFVTRWQLVGPFPWKESDGFAVARIGEPAVDPKARYATDGGERAWKPVEAGGPSGLVDMSTHLGAASDCIGYGLARIVVPAATDAVIRAGSDDGIKIWLNGNAVHENNVNRGTAVDQDQVPVKLKAGENVVLVAITQGGGGWNFCLRLTNPDGAPLEFQNPSP